jgi:hypothetical protein
MVRNLADSIGLASLSFRAIAIAAAVQTPGFAVIASLA